MDTKAIIKGKRVLIVDDEKDIVETIGGSSAYLQNRHCLIF